MDHRLGVHQHGVVKAGLRAGTAGDAQAFQHLGQDALVADALLDGRFNAQAPFTRIADGELAVVVDVHLAAEALGLEQEEVQHAVDQQVIDLRHLAIHHQAKVMQHGMQLAVLVVAVDVVRRVALALQAALGAGPFLAQPGALRGRDLAGLLQVLEQLQSPRLVVGCLDEHVLVSL